MTPALLQPAPGLASYTLGQKTTISERYAQIFQAPIYIVRVVTAVNTITVVNKCNIF
jgi:tRNA U34 2-thiouridine synthase MnmA/TrmU